MARTIRVTSEPRGDVIRFAHRVILLTKSAAGALFMRYVRLFAVVAYTEWSEKLIL